MRLLHPFMPFITEEIWQHLPHEGKSITVAKWPEVRPELSNREAAEEMRLLVDIIRAVRNIRAEVNTPLSKPIKLHIKAKDEQVQATLEKNRAYLERFCNPSELIIATDIPAAEKAMTAVVTGAELILPLEGLINIEEEIKRLEKELEKLDKEVERVQKKLSNEGFLAKAPAHVVEEERRKEKDYLEKREAVRARLAELKK
jgi:valyl-tRNA synthetase